MARYGWVAWRACARSGRRGERCALDRPLDARETLLKLLEQGVHLQHLQRRGLRKVGAFEGSDSVRERVVKEATSRSGSAEGSRLMSKEAHKGITERGSPVRDQAMTGSSPARLASE